MKNKKYQEIEDIIRIMEDGFIWELIEWNSAECHIGSLYELHDDGSESLIEKEEDINRNSVFGVKMGFIDNNIAKSILKHNGHFTNNLWSVEDVQNKYKTTDEEAQNILDKALTNEATMEQIWISIDIFAEIEGFEPQ